MRLLHPPVPGCREGRRARPPFDLVRRGEHGEVAGVPIRPKLIVETDLSHMLHGARCCCGKS